MHKAWYAIVAALLLSGCYHNTLSLSPQASPLASPSEFPGVQETPMPIAETVYTLDLAAQSNSGQTGTAMIQKVDGKVRVIITLDGEKTGASEPAHIHSGTCAKPGPVINGLKNVEDGASLTELATTTDAIKAAGATIINVHKSDSQMGVYVACGVIPLAQPSMQLQRASPKPAEPSAYPYMIY